MRYLEGSEVDDAERFLEFAIEAAQKSKCRKSQRGVVIVREGWVITSGYNKPLLEELCEPCLRDTVHDNSRVELCKGIHAEQMAIINARDYSLKDTTMFHIKLKNGVPVPSENPSCTVCSRMIAYAGMEFVLWQKEGYMMYMPEEFNNEGFKYFTENKKIKDMEKKINTITLCSSALFFPNLYPIKSYIENEGYNVLLPSMKDYHDLEEKALAKIQNDLISEHFRKIDESDAIYIANFNKNDIKGYIGGNTFLEMGHAFYRKIPIFLMKDIPKVSYKEEILAMKPIVIGKDYGLIKKIIEEHL